MDEGHIIKNPATKLSKMVHMLPTKHRLLLTGKINNIIVAVTGCNSSIFATVIVLLIL